MGNSQSTFFRPISYTCYELGHTWNPSCTQSSVEVGLTCFEEALKIYASVYTVRVALLSLKWQSFVFIASKCCFSSFLWCWGADFLIKRPWWPCWKTFSDLQPSYLTMLSTLSGPFALSGKHDRNNLLLYYHYYSIHSVYSKVTNNRVETKLSSLRAIVYLIGFPTWNSTLHTAAKPHF